MAKKKPSRPKAAVAKPQAAKAEQAAGLKLEDALIALQKTFSRVAAATQANRLKHPTKPTAIIVGAVHFDLSLKLTPVSDGKHAFELSDNGSVGMTLSGSIDTDAKVRDTFDTSKQDA